MGAGEFVLIFTVWVVIPILVVAIAGFPFGLHKLARKKQAIVVGSALLSVALSYAIGQLYTPLAFVPLLLLPLLASKFEGKLSWPRSVGFAFTYVIVTVVLQLLAVTVAGVSFS